MQLLVDNIDYGLPLRDLFKDFATLMMGLRDGFPRGNNYNTTTHVLQLASAMRPARCKEATNQGIPSWVPDWTGTMRNKPLYHTPANKDSSLGIPKHQYEVVTLEDNRRALVVVGLVPDVVTAVIPFDIRALSGAIHQAKDALNDFLLSIAKRFDETGFFPNAEDIYTPTGQHIISAIAVNWWPVENTRPQTPILLKTLAFDINS